ncbi:MAG TPA: BTAD domain-containing putative transcriptional regulator [Streptosporangiaceae bacterium]|nr:BTAD domain-containing putative transcriptional regulator [Streptosporangiaceae bacterium]
MRAEDGRTRIRLLGPVDVVADGRGVELGPPQRRAVFAALAVDAGRLVSLETLIGRVWDEPPDRAMDSLYAHVARLRKALAAVPVSIERRSGGYALLVEPDLVDLHRFHDLERRARGAAGMASAEDGAACDAAHVALLDEAIGLWRGSPLTDVPGGWAARIRHGIEQQFVGAVVSRAQAQLRLGRPDAVVTEVAGLVLRYPLVEPLAGVLMRGLCALGRSAEALAHYARLRGDLVEHLGIEPAPELRALHAEILRGDHDRPPEPARQIGHIEQIGQIRQIGQNRPARLPPVGAGFTGRTAELAALDGLLTRPSAGPPAPAICAIIGPAGVGKTALAVRWAHRMTGRFPDGQLYVDLRGDEPNRAVDPGEALAGLLGALGVPASDIPAGPGERAVLLRGLLARRRVLMVLDNAASGPQVRPLLAGGPGCAIVVTSRAALADLAGRDGARRLTLDPLTAGEALTLLRRVAGDRVDGDPVGAATLVDRCARLPIALRIAGELAAARPATGFAELADELAAAAPSLTLPPHPAAPRRPCDAVRARSPRGRRHRARPR